MLNTILEVKDDNGKVTHSIKSAGVSDNSIGTVRVITTGAMQRRFNITEEVFIESDSTAKVIKSRLLNASYCDLDFQDTIDGVNYICGVLEAGAATKDGVTASVRASQLLSDGTIEEKY